MFADRLEALLRAEPDPATGLVHQQVTDATTLTYHKRTVIEDFLADRADDLLAVVKAAQEIADKHHGSAQRAVEQSGLRHALRALEAEHG